MQISLRAVLLIFVASTLMNGQGVLDLREMRRYFEKDVSEGPWTFLQSPRNGLGVGTIYTKFDGQTLVYSRPDDCFSAKVLQRASDPTVNGNLQSFTVNKTGRFSWEIGLRVANTGPITEEVNAEFKRKGVTTVKINYGALKRNLITIKDLQQFVAGEMDADCRASFGRKKPERVIVIETLTASSATLVLEDNRGNQASIKAGIMKILFPSFKLNPNGEMNEVKGEMSLASDHIVAVKMVKAGQISNMASQPFSLVPSLPQEYYSVFGAR